MGTGLLTPVVQYLLQRLDEEARLVGDVKYEVNSLRRELSFISWYLDQSKGKRKEHAISNVVIEQIRERAYEAEDIIDTYILLKTPKRSANPVTWIRQEYSKLEELVDLAKTIVSLKNEINNIFNNGKTYAIERGEPSVDAESDRKEALHRRWSEANEDDVVGFDENSKALEELYFENGSQLDVISIIGMGGLGKTTLARNIYNSPSVRGFFTRRAWVDVSQNDKTRELLLKILREMPISEKLRRNLEGKREDGLKETLSKYLNGERYLVVMDDVWKIDFWAEVRSVFPNNSNGSKILITSRNEAVALKAKQHSPSSRSARYILRHLNEDESWKLFEKKVFRGGTCRPELKALGRQLAKGCDGLPLSIVVLGGILANERQELLSWMKFIRVNRYLTECKDILALSYTYLPQHLKPCFLYLGAYPADFKIPVRQLINLWIAEGFIEHTPGKSPEDVAEEYLEELIYRNLIQVASKRTDRRSIKTCRIHDLLRDLCITQSAEEKFLEVVTKGDHHISQSTSRRLSIQGSIYPYIYLNPSHHTVPRSLLFLGGDSNEDSDEDSNEDSNEFDEEQWTWVEKNFQLIRVLNFGKIKWKVDKISSYKASSVGELIGKLIHLRYLGIDCDALKKVILSSICKLTNLETLDMRRTSPEYLPEGIEKLRRLRNLYVRGPVRFPNNLDRDADPLWSLEVLSTVSLTPDNVEIFKAKLPHLRKLGICFADDSHSHVLNSLSNLTLLQKLKIINYSERHCVVPISFPCNITKITLKKGWLDGRGDGRGDGSDSMTALGTLPRLMILKLKKCSLPSNLIFVAGSFPQLEVLKLIALKTIKEWNQERGAMPCLKHLVINQCLELTMLPSESLSALQHVEVLGSSVELVQALQILQENLRFNLVIDRPDPNNTAV